MTGFDDALLDDFANHHYGFGDYQGDFWFVGMEEGGGNSLEDVELRLKTWRDRGRLELDDVAGYHIDMGITYLFRERPRIQTTWRGLIRILLAAKGHSPATDQVRECQRDCLGRPGGETCLLELLPLPSPSTRLWLYGEFSQLPYLVDRKTYQQALFSRRIEHLQQRNRQYRPKVVLFYGYAYQQYWREIASVDFLPAAEGDFQIACSGSQVFVMTKHPATTGLRNDYFHRVGRAIAAELGAAGG